MAILYEERPLWMWFWAVALLLVIFTAFEFISYIGAELELTTANMLILSFVVLLLLGMMFGNRFAVTDEGIEYGTFFVLNLKIPFKDMEGYEPAEQAVELVLGRNRYNRQYGPLIRTESKRQFYPSAYYTPVHFLPWIKGVVVYINDTSVFFALNNAGKALAAIKERCKKT